MPEELPEIDLFKIPLTYDWNEEPNPLPDVPKRIPGRSSWRSTKQRVTDEKIRELSKTMNAHKIASQLGMSVDRVETRIRELRLETVAVLSTESERFVESSLDAVANLSMNIERTKLLQEACDEWLRDADDPNKYNIGPRSHEIDVTYIVELETPTGFKYEKRKKPLSDLLTMIEDTNGRISRIEKAESKYSDPRELILKTAQEVRHTMSVAAEIAKMLADVRSMQAFRDAVIQEIGKIDEETGKRIAQAVRRSIVLQGALGGLENMVAAQ